MNDLLLVPVLLGLAVWIAGVVFVQLFKRRLRSDHSKLATEIAPPLKHKSMSTDLAFMRFILARRYRLTGDKLLIHYGNVTYACLVIILIGLVCFARVIVSSQR